VTSAGTSVPGPGTSVTSAGTGVTFQVTGVTFQITGVPGPGTSVTGQRKGRAGPWNERAWPWNERDFGRHGRAGPWNERDLGWNGRDGPSHGSHLGWNGCGAGQGAGILRVHRPPGQRRRVPVEVLQARGAARRRSGRPHEVPGPRTAPPQGACPDHRPSGRRGLGASVPVAPDSAYTQSTSRRGRFYLVRVGAPSARPTK